MRVDPADEPTGQAVAGLELGAVGLKLHPRGENFSVADGRLDDLFGLADERRLPVMIHAGVGDPSIGPEALERARRSPGARIILAHCAVGSFEQVIHQIEDLPNLFFDTAWWNPADIWALFRMVPPSRILYASDVPFTSPACAMISTGRLGTMGTMA